MEATNVKTSLPLVQVNVKVRSLLSKPVTSPVHVSSEYPICSATRSSMKRARATMEARKGRVNGLMSGRLRHASSGAASFKPTSSSSTCGGESTSTCSARHKATRTAVLSGAATCSSGTTCSLARRFLHEGADPCLVDGGQLLQREGDRPHRAFVEVRLVAEPQRRVPRLELVRALEEADDLAVLGVRGHPVPGSRRESGRAGLDDGVEPFGHGAIPFRHLGDLREHVAFPVRLARARSETTPHTTVVSAKA